MSPAVWVLVDGAYPGVIAAVMYVIVIMASSTFLSIIGVAVAVPVVLVCQAEIA